MNQKVARAVPLLVASCALALGGCRGDVSARPPIHLNPNMDVQARLNPQAASVFFPDGRAMRPYVDGTVPRGSLHSDDHLYRGRKDGEWANALPPAGPDGRPITPNLAFFQRGQERFGIFCAPCHDPAGTGNGIVVQRGMMRPPSFYDERLLAMPVGQIVDVIAHGARNMPPYAAQIPVVDRWAIASYVRALQLSRNASLEQVPADEAGSHRWRVR